VERQNDKTITEKRPLIEAVVLHSLFVDRHVYIVPEFVLAFVHKIHGYNIVVRGGRSEFDFPFS
jgi:hypothetical protein